MDYFDDDFDDDFNNGYDRDPVQSGSGLGLSNDQVETERNLDPFNCVILPVPIYS